MQKITLPADLSVIECKMEKKILKKETHSMNDHDPNMTSWPPQVTSPNWTLF